LLFEALCKFHIDQLEEKIGLDVSHHYGAAYDMMGPKMEDVEELIAHHHGKVEAPKEVAQAAMELDL